jgi:hypothetical protein
VLLGGSALLPESVVRPGERDANDREPDGIQAPSRVAARNARIHATTDTPSDMPFAATDTPGSSLLWPALDPIEVEPGTLTFAVTGTDPIGDRPLLLWSRPPSGEAHLLARTTSDTSGHFDFGRLATPSGALELVVTDAAGDPLARSPVRVVGIPQPPLVVDEPGWDAMGRVSERQIRIHPAVFAGELHILDGSDRVIRRIALDVPPPAGALVLDRGALPDAATIVQLLPDGRESAAIPLD